MSDKFVTITIDWDGKQTTVDKPEVKLYYGEGYEPNAVIWRVASKPPEARGVKIMWNMDSPFDYVGPQGDDVELRGTTNRKVKGRYLYSVLFVDANGQVLAGVDPTIVNDGGP